MKIRIITEEQQKVSNWSGGKTRQLAIFPEDGDYISRDFIWRLSTAQSDRDESSFSRLEGFDRILMVLEGDVVLAHGDERSVHLGPMEQDSFDGGTKTRCFGRLEKDYNLIMAKGCTGSLRVMELTPDAQEVGAEQTGEEAGMYVSYGFFCMEGYAVINCGDRSEMIRPGTQLVIDMDPSDGIDGKAIVPKVMGEGRCILAEVAFATGEEVAFASGKEDPTESGSSDETQGTGARDKTSFAAEYGSCMKLFLRNNRWSKMFRREGADGVYYDRPLSAALGKLERRYVTTLIWAAVCLLCFLPALMMEKVVLSICLAAGYSVIHMLLVAPLIYYISLPKPLEAHMKNVDELNAIERMHHTEEIAKDPHMERVMSKYSKDDDNYFTDDKSMLYRLVKKK